MQHTHYTFNIQISLDPQKAHNLSAKVKTLGHSSLKAFVKNQIDQAFFALDVAEIDQYMDEVDRMSLGRNGPGRWIEEIEINLDEGNGTGSN